MIRTRTRVAASMAALLMSAPNVSTAQDTRSAAPKVVAPFFAFAATRFGKNSDLFVSDGTKEGTKFAVDLAYGFGDAAIYQTWPFPGGIVLIMQRSPEFSKTPQGVYVINRAGGKTALRNRLLSDPSLRFELFGEVGERLYITATDGGGASYLVSTDGTQAGTRIESNTPYVYATIFKFRGDVHFFANQHDRRTASLFRLVPGSTEPQFVMTLPDDEAGLVQHSSVRSLGPTQPVVTLGDKFVFWRSTRQFGTEPWVSDGTPAGTRMLKNIAVAEWSSNVRSEFTVLKGGATFVAAEREGKTAIWRTDGTPGGTRLVKSIIEGEGIGPVGGLGQQVRNGEAYFFNSLSNRTATSSYWRTDGTPEGTRRLDVKDGGEDLIAQERAPYLVSREFLYFYGSTFRTEGQEGCRAAYCFRSNLYRLNLKTDKVQQIGPIIKDGCTISTLDGQTVAEYLGTSMGQIAPFLDGVVFDAVDRYGGDTSVSACRDGVNAEPWIYLPGLGSRKIKEIEPGKTAGSYPVGFVGSIPAVEPHFPIKPWPHAADDSGSAISSSGLPSASTP